MTDLLELAVKLQHAAADALSFVDQGENDNAIRFLAYAVEDIARALIAMKERG